MTAFTAIPGHQPVNHVYCKGGLDDQGQWTRPAVMLVPVEEGFDWDSCPYSIIPRNPLSQCKQCGGIISLREKPGK